MTNLKKWAMVTAALFTVTNISISVDMYNSKKAKAAAEAAETETLEEVCNNG